MTVTAATLAAPRRDHNPLVAGIDIGGTKVLGVALDDRSRVVATSRLVSNGGADGVIRTATEALHRLAQAAGVDVGEFASVGVGVPGLVRPRSGVVSHAVNLGVGAGEVDLGDRLWRAFGVPVIVENDVNAAALGASAILGLHDVDLAYLSIGTGLAAGLVSGGQLRRGARGGAGEIGHIPVDPQGALCACGQRGCLETTGSGSALDAAAASARGEAWSAAAGAHARSSAIVFAAASQGDTAAITARDGFTDAVAAAVRLLVLTCDVDTVVLGGGVTELGSALLDEVCQALHRQAARSPFLRALDLPARVTIVPADSQVAAVGAALAGRAQPLRP